MNLIALTDIHDDIPRIGTLGSELASADVVLVTGDLTSFGGWRDVHRVISAIREHNDSIVAICGNCDGRDVHDYLQEADIGLHGTHRLLNGLAFIGVGGALPCSGATPNEHEESALKSLWLRSISGLDDSTPRIMLSHQPPRGTKVDCASHNTHVGSVAVRAIVEEQRPLICFSGHIHEAKGKDRLGSSWLVNPGPLGHGGYAWAAIDDGQVQSVELRTC